MSATELVTTGIAERTSRRSFLGRSGKWLLGAVGGGTLFALSAQSARAQGCSCSNPCLYKTDCTCYPKYRFYYQCPDCNTNQCQYSTCTNFGC